MIRLKAFTLIELIVVMIITSVVFVAAYFAYSSSVSRFSLFQSTTKGKIDITTLNLLLSKDFSECESVSLTSAKQLTIVKQSTNEIHYVFDRESVYRKDDNQTDTFEVSFTRIETEELEADRRYLSKLTLFTGYAAKDLNFDYYKTYSAYFLINNEGK